MDMDYKDHVDKMEINSRFDEIEAANAEGQSPNYMPDIYIGDYDSWSRFDFALTYEKTHWEAARTYKNCSQTTADVESQVPALSERELESQNCTVEDFYSCQLKWYPGETCYHLAEAGEYTDSKGNKYAGYDTIAKKFGYRMTAGPSGTTAAFMKIFSYLNVSSSEDRVKLRDALLTWMVRTNDHSIFEISLAAEPFMPEGEQFADPDSSIRKLLVQQRKDYDDEHSTKLTLTTPLLVALLVFGGLCIVVVAYYGCQMCSTPRDDKEYSSLQN